ncbi:hypothetical protein COOONC_18296 [Cooperia oncophora]
MDPSRPTSTAEKQSRTDVRSDNTAMSHSARTHETKTTASKDELEKEEWYHGMIPIEDVKTILHEDGDFIVRKAEHEMKSNPVCNCPFLKRYSLTSDWLEAISSTSFHYTPYTSQKPSHRMFSINYGEVTVTHIQKHWMEKKPVFRDILLIRAAPKQVFIKNCRVDCCF